MSDLRPPRFAFLSRLTQLPVWQSLLWRRASKFVLWAIAIFYFGFAGLFLTLRYVVLPHIADYRDDLERALTSALHLPVSIHGIAADWQGLRPRLTLSGVAVSDAQGRPALALDNVEAVLAWSSALHLSPRLYRLDIVAPSLEIRREADGKIFVAGLPVDTESNDSSASDWVLAQHQIVIRDANVTWTDGLRGAPPLALTKVNFNLANSGSKHRFGFTAEPPPALASRLDIRGDFKGRDLDALEAWKGQVYAELDYADLAVWRTWVDYPLSLPQGTGGLRLWLDFVHKELTSITADVSLANVNLRLAKELPMLELEHLNGRIAGSRIVDSDTRRFSLSAKQLSLATRDGLKLPTTDFHLVVEQDAQENLQKIDADINQLDLGTLRRLAEFLPLSTEQRETLKARAPSGRLQDVAIAWARQKKSDTFSIKGKFAELALAADGHIPGVTGLSGQILGNQDGGTLELNSRNTSLFMPAIFAEPQLDFTTLSAKTSWKMKGAAYDINLAEVRFSNKDAEGTLSGRYQAEGSHAGVIDLNGQITRADGTAVWRYLPLSVNKDAREWVKNGIVAGKSNDVKLTLKGDLHKFPFHDGSGTFKVLINAQDAAINPAPGWPQIQHIDGEVAFINAGLHINANKGQLLGASLGKVQADIADLDSHTDQTLTITGKAQGPTQEFLKFIEASPVGNRINHFTAPMVATGNGALDLKLKLTLHHIDHSTVEGSYQFDNNRLTPDPSLPALTEVKGKLDFTGEGITVRDAKANMLGSPVVVNVVTGKEGQIDVTADGQFSIPALRKLYPLPIFEQLSGSGRWRGNIAIRKSDVDVRFTSDLLGLSSSLPEPFNKSAATPLDFRFERKPAPIEVLRPVRVATRKAPTGSAAPTPAPANVPSPNGRRELTEVVIGKLLRGQFVRRIKDSGTELERGLVTLGDASARLPDRGVLLSAQTAKIDVDLWRRLLTTRHTNEKNLAEKANADIAALPFTQLDVRANEVVAMNRTLHDVRLNAQLLSGSAASTWRNDFKSREITANLDWTPGVGSNAGRVSGRISQLSIPDPNAQVANMSSDEVNQLPALALTVDKLSLRGKEWGEVKLDAENRAGYWHLKLSVNNEDGNLTGEGRWRPDPVLADSAFDFKVKAKSIERLLARMGYAEAIRRGNATIEGSLSWNGSPLNLDYPSLSGKLKVDMQSGQFNKLEPGIGRLLGILSLQSLPRRITLDFRDVFSDGFAFDSIRGQLAVNRGIMDTQDLEIKGPAAKVLMKGTVNLAQETQNLSVRVQPALGESIAVGAMLANPAVGAVAWVAQKILRDPVDQIFAFNYMVTGSWDDPKVTKGESVVVPVTKDKDGTKPGATSPKDTKDVKETKDVKDSAAEPAKESVKESESKLSESKLSESKT